MYYLITKPNCPACTLAKDMLEIKGLAYQAFPHDTHPMFTKLMLAAGMRTYPQIWEGSTLIGGADDLEKHLF